MQHVFFTNLKSLFVVMNGEMRSQSFLWHLRILSLNRAELLPLMGYILEHTLNQLYA